MEYHQINFTGQEIDERLQNIGTAEDVAAADGTLYARISKNADDVDELRDTVGHIDSAQTATNKTVTQHTADISTLQTALKTKANLVLGKVSVNELPVATSLGNPNNGTIPTTFAVSKAINDKIVGLLNWQGVKDTTDEIKDIALAKKGDVWHSNEDGSEWVCTEDIFTADHSVWKELGTPIDLSGYYTYKFSAAIGNASHVEGTGNYFKRGLAIGLSVEQCEEVDEVPQTINTKAYEDKVDSLIRNRYSLSEELGILRQKDTKKAEYDAYFAYCEQCKAEAKEWFKEHPNGDLPPLPQVEEVTDYLSETTDDVVGFGQ